MTDFVDELRAQGKPVTADLAEQAIERACRSTEKTIQKLLLDLENDTLRRVAQVTVDTRNFANCAVDIVLEK
ncbi:MAG TPA: hypothetical protein VG758_21110 [Hyphomicrobiaceae bacterium]|jgi:hypothetical protein|nr:hypothetical protein [Hyphomicrobiaceae bacterium]